MLPDWAPNLHPLVIHFPIALLVVAFVVDVAGLFLRQHTTAVRAAAVALYGAGAIGAAVAYVTGNQAAESLTIPTEAIAAVNDHQDFALYTLTFFVVYAMARLALLLAVRTPPVALRFAVTVAAVAGLYLLWGTGDRGGRLVYQHGLGVTAVESMAAELKQYRDAESLAEMEEARPVVREDGSWTWVISPGADRALTDDATFIEGSPDDIHVVVQEPAEGDPWLAIHPLGPPVMFVFGGPLSSLDMEVILDAADFDGSVSVVHNVQDEDTYHFLRIADDLMQGRRAGGREERLNGGDRRSEGWTTIRVTGDRGHFYAYEDGRTVAHGHSATPDAGFAGLRIEGRGALRLRRIDVVAVR